MRPTEQYRRLFDDLKADPNRYFDYPSPLGLSAFLGGYEHGDPLFPDYTAIAHDIIVSRYSSTGGVRAGTILYLAIPNLLEGYEIYISSLIESLSKSEVDSEHIERQPLQVSLKELLPDLLIRAPMLIGSWDARDLYTFLQGLFRALEDCGHDTTRDRHDLDRLEEHLQTEMGRRGRWDRLLFAGDLGQGRSVLRFVDLFEKLSRDVHH